ncbi:MAG: hypothetical protein JXR67_06680 [Bacteroidales bacterium]|nr:hypothetical protein [Bacteroidales bacterium]
MKRIIIFCLTCLMVIAVTTGCSSSRKNFHELKGLMLLSNLQLEKNKAFYSKHNTRTRNDALKRYRKNNRALNARRK